MPVKKDVADRKLAILQEYADFFTAEFMAEMEKDQAYYEFGEFLWPLVEKIVRRLTREQNLAGTEYGNATDWAEQKIANLASEPANTRAVAALAALKGIDKPRMGPGKKKPAQTPPAPPPGA